jgi:hypothetical protein
VLSGPGCSKDTRRPPREAECPRLWPAGQDTRHRHTHHHPVHRSMRHNHARQPVANARSLNSGRQALTLGQLVVAGVDGVQGFGGGVMCRVPVPMVAKKGTWTTQKHRARELGPRAGCTRHLFRQIHIQGFHNMSARARDTKGHMHTRFPLLCSACVNQYTCHQVGLCARGVVGGVQLLGQGGHAARHLVRDTLDVLAHHGVLSAVQALPHRVL